MLATFTARTKVNGTRIVIITINAGMEATNFRITGIYSTGILVIATGSYKIASSLSTTEISRTLIIIITLNRGMNTSLN
jgi:hypothetical protein